MAKEDWKGLFEEAQKKGIDLYPLALQGYSYDQLKQIVSEYKPPRGALKELIAGAGRGYASMAAGLGGLGEMLGIPGARDISQYWLKKREEWAPSPKEGIPGRVAGLVGEIVPYALTAVLAPEVAIPTMGSLMAGEFYAEQPEGKKSVPRALAAGGVSGALMAIPIGRLGRVAPIVRATERAESVAGKAVESAARAVKAGVGKAEQIVPTRIQENLAYRMAREGVKLTGKAAEVTAKGFKKTARISPSARMAVEFPLTTYAMGLAAEYGITGDIHPKDLFLFFLSTPEGRKELLAQAIAGAVIGVPEVIRPIEEGRATAEKRPEYAKYDEEKVLEAAREYINRLNEDQIDRLTTEALNKKEIKKVIAKTIEKYVDVAALSPGKQKRVRRIIDQYADYTYKVLKDILAERETSPLALRREEIARIVEKYRAPREVEEVATVIKEQLKPPSEAHKEFVTLMRKAEGAKGEGLVIATERGPLSPEDYQKYRLLDDYYRAISKAPGERTAEDVLAIRRAESLARGEKVTLYLPKEPKNEIDLILPEAKDLPYKRKVEILPEEECKKIIDAYDRLMDLQRRRVELKVGTKRIRLIKKPAKEDVAEVAAKPPEVISREAIIPKLLQYKKQGRRFALDYDAFTEGELRYIENVLDTHYSEFFEKSTSAKRAVFPAWLSKKGFTSRFVEQTIKDFKARKPLTKKQINLLTLLLSSESKSEADVVAAEGLLVERGSSEVVSTKLLPIAEKLKVAKDRVEIGVKDLAALYAQGPVSGDFGDIIASYIIDLAKNHPEKSPTFVINQLSAILPTNLAKSIQGFYRNKEASKLSDIVRELVDKVHTGEDLTPYVEALKTELSRLPSTAFLDEGGLYYLAKHKPFEFIKLFEDLRQVYALTKYRTRELVNPLLDSIRKEVARAKEEVAALLEDNPAFDIVSGKIENLDLDVTQIGPFVAVKLPVLKIEKGEHIPFEERTDVQYVLNLMAREKESFTDEPFVDLQMYETLLNELRDTPGIKIDYTEKVLILDANGKVVGPDVLIKVLEREFSNLSDVNIRFNKSVKELFNSANLVTPEEYVLWPRKEDGSIDYAAVVRNVTASSAFEALKPRYIALRESIPSTLTEQDFLGLAYHAIREMIGEDVALHVLKEKDPRAQAIMDTLGPRVAGFTLILKDKAHVGILLNGESNPIKTLFHELFHVAAHKFTNKDIEVLRSKFGDKWEELAAEEFAKFIYEKKYEPQGLFRKIVYTLKDYFDRIVNALRGLGFDSVYAVYRRIEAGEYRSRILETGKAPRPEEVPPHIRTVIEQHLAADLSPDEVKLYLRQLEGPDRQPLLPSEEQLSQMTRPGTLVGTIQHFFNNIVSAVKVAFGREFPAHYNFITPNFIAKKNPAVAQVYKLLEKAAIKANEVVMEGYDPAFAKYKALSDKQAKAFTTLTYFANIDAAFYNFDTAKKLLKSKHPELTPADIEKVYDTFKAYKKFGDYIFVEQSKALFIRMLASYEKDRVDLAVLEDKVRATGLWEAMYKQLLSEGKSDLEAREMAMERAISYYHETVQELRYIIEAVFTHADKAITKDGKDIRLEGFQRLFNLFTKLETETTKEFAALFAPIISSLGRYQGYWNHLRETFYMPRLRNGGRYEVRVLMKVDKETYAAYRGIKPEQVRGEGPFYIPVGYYTTPKRLSDSYERVELKNIVDALHKHLAKQGKVEVFSNLDDRRAWLEKGPDFVLLQGRIPEKEVLASTRLEELTPAELMEVINALSVRVADDPEMGAKLRGLLKGTADRLIAQISYAKARSIQRVILPEEVGRTVLGFKEDPVQVFNRHVINMANYIANSYFLSDYVPLLSHTDFVKMLDVDTKRFIRRWVDMVVAPMNETARFVYRMRMLAAMYYLGFRISSAVVNLSSILTTYLPELSSYIYPEGRPEFNLDGTYKQHRTRLPDHRKIKQAASEFKKATSDMIAYWKGNKERLSKEEAEMMDLLYKEGMLAPQFLNTLRMEAMGAFGRNLQAFIDFGLKPFQFTEEKMRQAGALAAYRVFRKHGATHEAAIAMVRQITKDAFFDYTRINRYWWTNPSSTGTALLNIPTTLGGFKFNYMSWMLTAIKEEGAGIYLDKVLTSFAAFAALGGLFAVPFLDDTLRLIENTSASLGKPLFIRRKMINMTRNWLGEGPAKVLLFGPPFYLGGVDFGPSLKLELPIPTSFRADDLFDYFFGVHANELKRFAKAYEKWQYHDRLGALAMVIPLMEASMAIQALDLMTEGLRSPTGKPVRDLEGRIFKLKPQEAALRALGFRPARLAEMQDLLYTGKKLAAVYKEKRDKIYSQLRRARTPEDMRAAMDAIMRYNQEAAKYRGAIPMITPRSIRQAMKERPDKTMRAVPLI